MTVHLANATCGNADSLAPLKKLDKKQFIRSKELSLGASGTKGNGFNTLIALV